MTGGSVLRIAPTGGPSALGRPAERKATIDRGNVLPLTRQASLRHLSRSSVYYLPRPVPPARLAIMQRIDALHLEHPFAGSRMLRAEGMVIGRRAVATLMRRMASRRCIAGPTRSDPRLGTRSTRNCCATSSWTDRTKSGRGTSPRSRWRGGLVYLAAVVDWSSRRVLAWRLSITLGVEFCLDAVNEALALHGKPEIFNTDLGSQFTSTDFTGLLQDQAIAISMLPSRIKVI